MALKAIVKRLIGPALTRRIQQARLPHYDGRQAKQWWRTRDRDEAGLTEFYWQSRQAPARRAIAEAVAALDGDSLLEIGCHAGPNALPEPICRRPFWPRRAAISPPPD
jgi:hypothetical protein